MRPSCPARCWRRVARRLAEELPIPAVLRRVSTRPQAGKPRAAAAASPNVKLAGSGALCAGLLSSFDGVLSSFDGVYLVRRSRNGIVAAAGEWMAAGEAPDCKRISLDDTVSFDRLIAVVRAGRLIAAGPRPARRNPVLVKADERQRSRPHAGPPSSLSARIPALSSSSTTARFS